MDEITRLENLLWNNAILEPAEFTELCELLRLLRKRPKFNFRYNYYSGIVGVHPPVDHRYTYRVYVYFDPFIGVAVILDKFYPRGRWADGDDQVRGVDGLTDDEILDALAAAGEIVEMLKGLGWIVRA